MVSFEGIKIQIVLIALSNTCAPPIKCDPCKDECLETIERYGRAGVTHFIFSMTPPYLEDGIQAFAEEVIPKVRR